MAYWNQLCDRMYQRPAIFFLLISMPVFGLIGLWDILWMGPRGLHFMRQTDSLSFVMGYYQFEVPFWEPRIYNLVGQDGKAAGEFPWLYYLLAQVFKLTGPKLYLLRWLDFIIVLAGVYAFFRIALHRLKSLMAAYITAWLPFSSTVFFYYATGMVPDIPALGLCLMGWYFAYFWLQNGRKSFPWWALLCFTLAGLTKITVLVSVLALPGVLLLFSGSNAVFVLVKKQKAMVWSLVWALLALGASAAWAAYANAYNKVNCDTCFLMDITPYWSLTQEQIDLVWIHITGYWWPDYFQLDLWFVWGMVFVAALVLLIWKRNTWTLFFLPVLWGYIAMFVLFFRQFQNHDYYVITFYSAFALTLLSFQEQLLALPKWANKTVQAVLLVFLVMAFKRSDKGLDHRYAVQDDFAALYQHYENYYQVIDSLQIDSKAKFVVLGDNTPNGGFMAIRRQGFGIRDTTGHNIPQAVNMHQMRHFDYAIAFKGLDYTDSLKQLWGLQPILQNDSVQLYKVSR